MDSWLHLRTSLFTDMNWMRDMPIAQPKMDMERMTVINRVKLSIMCCFGSHLLVSERNTTCCVFIFFELACFFSNHHHKTRCFVSDYSMVSFSIPVE